MKFKRFVINLDRRPDRLTEFFERYGDAGDVTRFSAVDGVEKFRDKKFNGIEKIIFTGLSFSGFGNRPGVFGCWVSHVRLWDELAVSDYDGFVIFEDDAFFVDDFQNKLNIILGDVTQNLDIIYIGGRFVPGFVPDEAGLRWFRVGEFFDAYKPCDAQNHARTTHGYIITRAGAKKLIDIIISWNEKRKLPAVDDWLNSLRHDAIIRSVDSLPHICYSPINYKTDIQGIFFSKKDRNP
jgi:GR25 family glycosyltransferase involved in LPS biosynthesis